ncbi:MAG: ribonuclease Y [Thermoleophilaceae bacterium]
MEIVLAAVVAAVVAVAVVLITQRSRAPGERGADDVARSGAGTAGEPRPQSDAASQDGRAAADPLPAAVAVEGGDQALQQLAAPARTEEAPARPAAARTPAGAAAAKPVAADRPTAHAPPEPSSGLELELRERRGEVARIEERLLTRERSLDGRLSELERREQSLEDRRRNIDHGAEELKSAKRDHVRELERIASLSAGQAKQILLREMEGDLRHERARLIRQAEEEAKRDSDRRARSILAACMQRLASGHAAETTVSVVPLESDELKGRVIGREGRNIRALETLTGIDFIIDDTPGVVALSGFDGVRREIARLTLERLLQDGRIHPARIEEAYYHSRSEIENRITEVGEQAVFEAGIGTLHPELTKLLGRLHYRTSYGQNVLAHSLECAHLAAMIGDELGASAKTARRAALLHDIGKAVTHEIEGPHALVGGQLARRHDESEAVAHAMEAHHNEVEIQTIEAVIVQIVDSLSGARPGARGESLERYTKRLTDLEHVAGRHAGVDRVYAMQAGREVRVIVKPQDVDDDTAAILSQEIARDVERELEYPGQIKVTVIRESRSVGFAR